MPEPIIRPEGGSGIRQGRTRTQSGTPPPEPDPPDTDRVQTAIVAEPQPPAPGASGLIPAPQVTVPDPEHRRHPLQFERNLFRKRY